MLIVKMTPGFKDWLDHLKDRTTRIRLSRRLDRAAAGNLGDVRPVGDGVFEMREHFGPGWRMYFLRRGDVLIIMLSGGDKRSQIADIETAREHASLLED